MSNPSLFMLWLSLQCQMISGCKQAALIQKTPSGKDRLLAHWPEGSQLNKALLDTAAKTANTGQIKMQKSESESVYFAHPIVLDAKLWGVATLNLSTQDPQVLQATIKLLRWGFTWLHVAKATTTAAPSNTSNDSQLLELISSALKAPSFQDSCTSTVNHIASLLDVERVSLGSYNTAAKLALIAVSHRATFDKNSEFAQATLDAMIEAAEQRTDIQYPNSGECIDHAHHRLCRLGSLLGCHTFLIRDDQGAPVGAITIEHKHTTQLSDDAKQFINQCALALADLHRLNSSTSTHHSTSNIFFGTFNKKHLTRLAAAVGAVLVMLAFVPWSYHVNSEAEITSTNRYLLATPFDGYIEAVNVEPGQLVTKGQPLAKLKADDLKLEQRQLKGQLQQYQLEYDNALAAGDRTQAAIMSTQADQVQVQIRLIDAKLERTILKSPTNGMIISDDIQQSIGAPVAQGDTLFEISDAEGFGVTLFIHEKNIAEIKPSQKGELQLSSLPGQYIAISVDRITPLSEVKDGSNYFKVEATLDENTSLLRPGMTGSSRVLIAKKTLGWIWFHDLWHRLRRLAWV